MSQFKGGDKKEEMMKLYTESSAGASQAGQMGGYKSPYVVFSSGGELAGGDFASTVQKIKDDKFLAMGVGVLIVAVIMLLVVFLVLDKTNEQKKSITMRVGAVVVLAEVGLYFAASN